MNNKKIPQRKRMAMGMMGGGMAKSGVKKLGRGGKLKK